GARMRRAARYARGLPSRFVELAWRTGEEPRPGRTRFAAHVAEPRAQYAVEPDRDDRTATLVWPVHAELGALRRRAAAAVSASAAGRHTAGFRQLREAIGGMMRRQDWAHTAEANRALADALLRRGRPADAQAALVDAREALGKVQDRRGLTRLAVL